jgi:signal transduction histidine kinase
MKSDAFHQEPFARPATALGMAVMTFSSFGWNVIIGSGSRLWLTLLGILFLVLGTVGWIWVERAKRHMMPMLVAVLFAISLAALWITRGGVMLMVMPIIGFAVIYGSIRWGIVITTLVLVTNVLMAIDAGADAVQTYSSSTGFIPGAVFAILIGKLIVHEREMREQIRHYAVSVEELATTRERNRIARDIHDSVGHYLTVVNVQIEAARAMLARDTAATNECLTRAQELARQGLGDLRRSVTMLRDGNTQNRPFGIALASLVDDCRAQGLETSLAIEGTPQPLTPAVEYTLFRTAQEALTNVTKHAQATKAQVTLRYGERDVSLAVVDDGIGAMTTGGGFGIIGLRERATLVNGTLSTKTSVGHGFTIEVRVPT